MKAKFSLVMLFLALFLPTIHAQSHSPNMGVVIQSTERSFDKSTAVVHLLNISDKEVTAFCLSVKQPLSDGKTFTSASSVTDLLGGYLSDGEAFSPNTTRDAQIGVTEDSTLLVDVVIYADGTAQVQNQDRFKDMIDNRAAHFRALEKIDDAIEKVLADPVIEHRTASVVAQLKAVQDDEEKKADTDNKARNAGIGSPDEQELERQIRSLARFVNRNEEAPLSEMLEQNRREVAKLARHVQVTQIQ